MHEREARKGMREFEAARACVSVAWHAAESRVVHVTMRPLFRLSHKLPTFGSLFDKCLAELEERKCSRALVPVHGSS